MKMKAAAAEALADYILEWLRDRNGGELRDAFDDMRVRDTKQLRAEFVLILTHGGKPPTWEDGFRAPMPMCQFCGCGVGFGHTMCGPCSDVP